MRKKRNVALPLVLALLLLCVSARAGTLKSPVPVGEPRLTSFETGAMEPIANGRGVVLVTGDVGDPGTRQALDFLKSYAKKLSPAGTDIVVNLRDAVARDPAVKSMIAGKGWNEMRITCGEDAGLAGKLAAAGADAGVSIAVIDQDGMVEHVTKGALTDSKKDALIQSALKTCQDAQLSLNARNKTVQKGKTFTLKPKLSPKVSAKYVRYQSSDTKIARVSQAGKVKGVGYGTAVITASFGDVTAECEVVVSGPLKSFKLTAASAGIGVGDSLELGIASIVPFNADVDLASAKWSSGNQRVAVVQGGTVTAIGPGKAKITAKLNGKSASCTVTVRAGSGGAALSGPMEDQILELVNIERGKKGLRPLTLYGPLGAAASVRAEEISRSFSHTRPNGKSCFTAIGFSVSTAGENIAMGFGTAESVMRAWMNSPGHKKNIMNGNFRELGVGVYEKDGTVYWAQMFSKKK